MSTTYKGRTIKALAVRNKPHLRKMVINGRTVSHGWQGTKDQALDWFKNVIDKMDADGPGRSTLQAPYERHWWEPGTFDVNPAGHVTPPGGICLCKPCVIDDPCGSKGRYAPLHPDACQHCHQLEGAHYDDVFLDWHRYTAPTEQQRAGRQAAIDEFQQDDDPDEAMCDAIYPDEVRGYLGRPRCLSFVDHRDAVDPKYHEDARGFRWRREAVR
ncbi:hypothetical protein [Streptomyces sp. NPDC058398]|uniref:hypothetical protein n=1 Tax=Streptomyces sp. NPDC058398 TaxID=3346479 RepID=UPI003646EE8C